MKRTIVLGGFVLVVVLGLAIHEAGSGFWIVTGLLFATVPLVQRPETDGLWASGREGRRRRIAAGEADRMDMVGLWLDRVGRSVLLAFGLVATLYGISLAL